ncbi:APC family permease [bacterium]|nr:MAG: APC family permease [bacterium]
MDDAAAKVTTLKARSVGLPEAVAMSAALIGPAVGVTAGNVFIAGFSGIASPLAFVFGTLVCIAIASVIGDYARKLPSAGSFYTYLTNTFGPKTGFVTGVLLFGAYVLLLPFQAAFFGSFVQGALANININLPWQLFSIALLLLSTALVVIGVRPSLGTVLVGLTFETVVFLVLALVIVAHGGATGNSLQPFNPSHAPSSSGLLIAVVYTIFAFVGFESATTLGEEVKHPTRLIPIAVFATTVIIGFFYIFVTYAEVIGFGVSADGLHQLQSNQSPFTDLATKYVGGWYSALVTLATISSFSALNIVTVIAGSRMVYAMGRDRMLPAVFGKVNVRHSPSNAAYAVGAWGIGVTVVMGSMFGPVNLASWFSYFATLFFIGAYILLCVGVIRFYFQKHRSEFNWFRHILVPLVALTGMAWVTYGNVVPVPAAPLSYFIPLTIAVIIASAIAAAFLERRNPQIVRTAGEIFAAATEEP